MRLPVLLLFGIVAFSALASAELCLPRFKDASEAFPKGMNAQNVNFLDVDNDGKPDLLVSGGRLFINRSEPGAIKFEEITKAAGLQGGGTALCFDYDNDGFTDIVRSDGKLYRNRKDNTFEDVSERLGFKPLKKTMTLAAGDLDNDGYADILLGMSEDWNNGAPTYYPMQLWRNDYAQAFEEIGKMARLNRTTYARSILVCDFNGDGFQDVFVANYRLQPNFCWINHKNMTFFDEALKRGVRGRFNSDEFFDATLKKSFGYRYGHCIAAALLDFDNDGQLDVWVSNLVHKYVGPSNLKGMDYDIRGYICDDSAIYRNQQGVFEDWREKLEVPRRPVGGRDVYKGDELWAGATVADVNLDGWPDVFVPQVYNLNYAKSRLFLNDSGKAFREVAGKAGVNRIDTYCGAWADLDGDGLVDLVTAGRPEKDAPGSLAVYRNEGDERIRRHAWVKVRLKSFIGTSVGALVTAEANGLKQLRINDAGSSTMGQQNDPDILFGFGELPADTPIAITVQWVGGKTMSRAVKANQVVEFIRK